MKYSKMLEMIQKALSDSANTKIDFCMTSKMAHQIELWSMMFSDNAPWLNKTTVSAGIPAAIAGEIARLTTLELKSEISGSNRADYLQKTYKKHILSCLRNQTEFGCAKGGLIIKPFVSSVGLEVQFIQADAFFPISFDGNGRISQCIFLDEYRKGEKRYSRLEIHEMRGGKVYISNRCFVSTNDYSIGNEISVSSVERWGGLESECVLEGYGQLPFGYFRVPIANAVENNSPLGVSVYSRSVDRIRIADKRYSQIDWEFDAKEAAVHVADSILKKNPETQKPEYPAGKERLYREFEYNVGAQDKPLLDAYSPDIRDQSYINGFNNQLRRIEFECNLAYGTLSDPNTVDKTAEEIRASKQRSYSFIADVQTALQTALEDAVAAMDFYCTAYRLAPAGEYDISFSWDDSIIVDANKERESDRQDVAIGAMPLWEYRAKWYGETEEQAKEMVISEE